MKKLVLALSSVVAMGVAVSSFAAGPQDMQGNGMMMSNGGGHPCRAIEEACKAAGYMRGGEASGKGLMRDCMKPIMSGKTVTGVNVNPQEIQACQTKAMQMRQQGGMMSQGPGMMNGQQQGQGMMGGQQGGTMTSDPQRPGMMNSGQQGQ